MSTYDESVAAARDFLAQLIRVRGMNRQDIDAKLGFNRGYVSRLIAGDTKLTYRHILQILDALGVEPEVFFNTLHARHRRPAQNLPVDELRELVHRLNLALPAIEAARPAESRTEADYDEISDRISDVVRRLAGPNRAPAQAGG